ncbi:hypothetical protein BGX28_000718 [Mortierella sp. GBA30]|nr:hypothetical protein BGX28_000718 [Mortierella sp. GBA30]
MDPEHPLETYYGYIETPEEAAMIIEGRVSRRLREKDYKQIRSGSVFCYDGNHFKLWRDGRKWQSYKQGAFTIGHELNSSQPEVALHGGLIRKVLSTRAFENRKIVVVSFYYEDDKASGKLQTPSEDPLFSCNDALNDTSASDPSPWALHASSSSSFTQKKAALLSLHSNASVAKDSDYDPNFSRADSPAPDLTRSSMRHKPSSSPIGSSALAAQTNDASDTLDTFCGDEDDVEESEDEDVVDQSRKGSMENRSKSINRHDVPGTSRKKRRTFTDSLAIMRHEKELEELKWDVRLHYNGWTGDDAGIVREAFSASTSLKQDIPRVTPDEELWMERIAEDRTKEDLDLEGIADLSPAEKKQWLLTRGRPLVAGGMCWAVEESNLFFQGLRRFGKHNVWAIQEHIKTRSLAEVVTMIQFMEAEVARRKYFGLDTGGLSKMPMADEADDHWVAVETACSSELLYRERQSYKQVQEEGARRKEASTDTTPEVERATELLRIRRLRELHAQLARCAPDIHASSRSIYPTESEIATELYKSLKGWLTPTIGELVILHHERHDVICNLGKRKHDTELPEITEEDVLRTLCARQQPLDAKPFFEKLASRYSSKEDGYQLYKWNRQNRKTTRQKYKRVEAFEQNLEMKAIAVANARYVEIREPGYGILPADASFMYDPTREAPPSGYGLGKRDHGGLYFADKKPHSLYSSSGYITVSDTEDEEEEERGWRRQMEADLLIDRKADCYQVKHNPTTSSSSPR